MPRLDPEHIETTLRPWLIGHVCPFWLARIRDPAGGFFEGLDATGRPVCRANRATLVQARLTYVFSHAFVLGGEAAFAEAATHGFGFLTRCSAAPDGGWYRAVAVNGDVLDEARDCCDQAFVLFALAWYFRATREQAAIKLAHGTWRFMEECLADRRHGGFFEDHVPGRRKITLPRRQNPHMHLLEALLALYVSTGEPVWLERSAMLVDLFKSRFVDPHSGALIEFFAEDWSPAAAGEGAWREPGHQFEWVWLLFDFFHRTRDGSVIEPAERLYRFGMRFGIEREASLRGAVFGGVDAQGNLVESSKLMWPQTEFIKACVARAEWLKDEEALRLIRAHVALISRYFMRPDGASWHNRLSREGKPIEDITPARVLYHLVLALAEVDRLPAVMREQS